MSKALIIIDIQNDYFNNGAMELIDSEKSSLNASRVISKFRENKLPVIFIQHIADYTGASFFLPNSFGVKIHDIVMPVGGEKIITKHYPNSFRETELNEHLKQLNVTDLIICGMMTHMCVDTTVRAAYDLGYNNILLGDACATKNLVFNSATVKAVDVQTSYLAAINGTFANVITVSEYLTSIMK